MHRHSGVEISVIGAIRITDRMIIALGSSFGALPGTIIEQIEESTYSLINQAQQVSGIIGIILSPDHLTVTPVLPPPPIDWSDLRGQVITQAQSAVGVTLGNLTVTQRLALVACLLYTHGAIDPISKTVNPLNQWMQTP